MGLLPSALGSVGTPTKVTQTVARSQIPTIQATPVTQAPPQAQPRVQQSTPIAAQYQTQPQSELPPKIAPIETPPETPPDGDRDLVALWQQILSNIEEIPARAILSTNCHIAELNGKEIKIGIFQKSSLAIVKARSPQLGKACAKTLKDRKSVV